MSKLSSQLNTFRGAFLQGLRFLLSVGIAIAVAAPFVRLSTYITSNTIERGLYIPASFPFFAHVAASFRSHVATNGAAVVGWYLSIFGLFCGIVEVLALRRGKDYQDELRKRFYQPLEVFWPTLRVAGTAILLALSVDTCWTNKTMGRVFAGRKKDTWSAAKHFLVVDFQSHLMMAFYLTVAVLIVTVIVLSAWFTWTFLFWGFLWVLIAYSRWLARLIGIQNATAPLASITMTLISMIISFLEHRL